MDEREALLRQAIAEMCEADGRRWRGRPLVSYEFDDRLPRGPHLQPGGAAAPSAGPVPPPPASALQILRALGSDCRVLDGLGLHQLCASGAAEAVELLSSGAIHGGAALHTVDGAACGLGKLYGDAGGQCQYLVDLQDDDTFAAFCKMAKAHPRNQNPPYLLL